MSHKTPEYQALKTLLPDVCSTISKQPHTIAPLADSLFAKKLINDATKGAVTAQGYYPPYQQASQLVSAVHGTVKLKTETLYTFADILESHDFFEISKNLLEECGKYKNRPRMGPGSVVILRRS